MYYLDTEDGKSCNYSPIVFTQSPVKQLIVDAMVCARGHRVNMILTHISAYIV